MRYHKIICWVFCLFSIFARGQFTPIPVSGFNQDAIAEGAPNSLATTTLQVDGSSSNKVMYTNAFRVFAGIAGGGLPDNGAIINGPDSYQLAPYGGNNALYIYRNEMRSLTLSTPAPYARIRLLCLSTEGASNLNISCSFTTGTSTLYHSNYSLPDWFNNTANIVVQGIGRCDRSVGPNYNADGFPTNPRLYYIDIPLNCGDRQRQLASINISNASTVPNNAPFPNTIILALSGISFIRTVTPVITASDCNGPNGSIALTVTGTTGPYTFLSWNTAPVQTGPIATGLTPGTYMCLISEGDGCVFPYIGTVPFNNNGGVSITANPVNQCLGGNTVLAANVTGGTFTTFTWNPGNMTGQTITVAPQITTTYTLSASNAIGCAASAQVTLNVAPITTFFTVNNQTICSGSTASLAIQNSIPGMTYNWYDAPNAGNLVGTGDPFVTPLLSATTTYYVEAVSTGNCRTSRVAVTVSVSPLPAAPTASNVTVCQGASATLSVSSPLPGTTYNWFSTATGGISIATGSSYTVNNVTAPVTYYVEANNAGCISNSRTAVNISLYVQLPAPVVTVSNTTINSLSFSWPAIPGATGYEVTTNGGLNYQSPSSGATGTTHVISGLAGNTTVTLQVRALRAQPCETSLLSAPVSGTTLSTKEIFVPNVFTPNNDGKNDRLMVFGNYVATMQFRIFNQWGQLIFYSDNISNGWDGSYKGEQQPVGVYAYTLKVVLNDNTIINKKGSINLIR